MVEPVDQGLSPPIPLKDALADCDLDLFECGEPSLDRWLRERAKAAEVGFARTFVVCRDRRVVAYYCLSVGSAERAHFAGRHRRNAPDPIPVLLLGRMAVDRSVQGRGLGRDLIADCFRRCLSAGEHVGARGLLVHPLNEALVPFYEGLGFDRLPGDSGAMFIAMETLAEAFEGAVGG